MSHTPATAEPEGPSPIAYAKAGDVHVAYRTLGSGPVDLVFVSGAVSNLELDWEQPAYVSFARRLATFSRFIGLDRRGVGLSDRVGAPPLEEQMEDVRAVLDAVRSERVVLFGFAEGGALLSLFAATYPERVLALVVYAMEPAKLRAADYPWGMTQEESRRWLEAAERPPTEDDLAAEIRVSSPSLAGDPGFVRWLARWVRLSVSPGSFVSLRRMNLETDVRDVLPAIRVPTLVLQRSGDPLLDPRVGRYVADSIPTASYVELPGNDHFPWSAAEQDALLDAVEAFVNDTLREPAPLDEADRILATILFTDVVGASAHAVALGDARWRELLREHHALIRRQLARHRGRELDLAGDGFFASFDGPARAIRCAGAIVAGVRELGLEVRAGVHTGECELLDGKLAGIAVHTGARIAAEAGPGEVLVSRTVRDLVAGSGLGFADRGVRELRGIPGEWRLYAVEDGA